MFVGLVSCRFQSLATVAVHRRPHSDPNVLTMVPSRRLPTHSNVVHDKMVGTVSRAIEGPRAMRKSSAR
jgi:hypothetical protein